MITIAGALTKGSATYKEKSRGFLTLLWDLYPDQVNLFITLHTYEYYVFTILAMSGTFPTVSVSAGHKGDILPSLYGILNVIHIILQSFQSYN